MKPIRFLWLGATALGLTGLLAIVLGFPLRTLSPSAISSPGLMSLSRPQSIRAPLFPGAAAMVAKELDRADAESRQAIEAQLPQLDQFFVRAAQGVPRFVDHVLGLESQWALVRDWLPGSQGGHHARHLRRAFHTEVFDPAELDRAVHQVVADTLQALQAIDDALLVRLRRDIDHLPTTAPITRRDRDRLLAATSATVDAALVQSHPAVAPLLAAEVAALVSSELATRAVLRRAAASGLVGALTASTPWSLGVSLVAGLAVDQAVSWAFDSWTDPRGTLIGRLDRRLAELRRLVLIGTTQAPGLRPRLERLLRERAVARRTLLLGLSAPSSGGPQP